MVSELMIGWSGPLVGWLVLLSLDYDTDRCDMRPCNKDDLHMIHDCH